MNTKTFYTFLLFFLVCITNRCKKNDAFTDPAKTLPPASTAGKSYYVSDAAGSDGNNGLSLSAAFKKISTAADIASPGDTIFIMNGTYALSTGNTINITKSGAPGKYITYKAMVGQSPKITCRGDVWNAVAINGSYIIFEGLDLAGNNANLTYASALASYNAALAGGASNSNAQYNTNAISIGGPGTESKFPHHVTIRNCKVHDFPGGGIISIQGDYMTIEDNTVYNNGWYMMYAGSGISILTPFNSDAASGYKNIVRNNSVYGNKTTIPWISSNPAILSDGNGIIIDVNLYPYNQPAVTDKPYTGRTLVENNVSYNNGGSGIHAYKTGNVDIINNTAFGNGTVVGYGEIYIQDSKNGKVMNNIMYARAGGKCNTNTRNTNVTYDYNIYFNGSVAVKGSNDKVGNPQFANLSVDALVANFNVTTGSPAINAGTTSIYSAKDIKGVARPLGAGVDCGAYEFQ